MKKKSQKNMLRIELVNPHRYSVTKNFLSSVARQAAAKEKKLKGKVEVVLVNDTEMRKMNYGWRGKNKTTDVLAFAWQESGGKDCDILGQIFVSHPCLKIQAKKNKVNFKKEWALVLTHGLLHLVGYDHIEEKEKKKMFSLQEKIIKYVD